MLTGALREQVARVHELDPLVRVGADASVHDLRVTVRRLRSILASYGPAFVTSEAKAIRGDLRWLGAQLGEVRDPEAQSQRLTALGHGGSDLHTRLHGAYREATASLLRSMDSPRYGALLARLDELAEDPPFIPAARVPAADLVRARAHRDWRRVRVRVSDLPTPGEDDFTKHLHEVRKSARHLQYLLESGRSVTGDKAARLRRRLKKFQRRLGDHHDATLTQYLLSSTCCRRPVSP